jgi:hypothetical protein
MQLNLARFCFLRANPSIPSPPPRTRLIPPDPALPLCVILGGGWASLRLVLAGVRGSLCLVRDGLSLSKFNPLQGRQGQTTWSRRMRQGRPWSRRQQRPSPSVAATARRRQRLPPWLHLVPRVASSPTDPAVSPRPRVADVRGRTRTAARLGRNFNSSCLPAWAGCRHVAAWATQLLLSGQQA